MASRKSTDHGHISKRKNRDGSISWLAQVRVAGFSPTSKTFPERATAQAWANEMHDTLRTQRRAASVRPDVSTLTLARLVSEFVADPETTRLRYFDDLHRLCCWWVEHYGSTRVLDLNVLTLREARALLNRGRGPATVNRYLSAARSCWNWGRSSGLVPQDKLWPDRLMLTEPKGRVRFLSDDELAAVLNAARKASPLMNAAVVVSIACGMRQSELRRLDWKDIDFQRQTLRINLSKNNESRTVYLPTAACDALRAHERSKVRGLGPVFVNEDGERVSKEWINYRWRPIREAAGLRDFRWHDLRHSCASFLAQQGATLLEIGAQLGHKSPSMTARYAHLVQGKAIPAHAALDAKLRK